MSKMKDTLFELWDTYSTMRDTINKIGIDNFISQMPEDLKEIIFREEKDKYKKLQVMNKIQMELYENIESPTGVW